MKAREKKPLADPFPAMPMTRLTHPAATRSIKVAFTPAAPSIPAEPAALDAFHRP
jgi:hypothetical protein